jgi:hypothetical protein
MALLRHRDEEVEAESLAERVQGVMRTCDTCGLVAACDVDAVLTHHGLDDGETTWGRCRECQRLGGGWQRTVAATRLGLPADAVLLDDVAPLVRRFAETPTAHPNKPQTEAWEHVSVRELGEAAERAKTALDQRKGGPCWICGTTLTPKGTRWATWNRVSGDDGCTIVQPHAPTCGRCHRWLDGSNRTDTGVRLLVAAVLLGEADPGHRPLGPTSIIEQTGVVLFADTGRSRGTLEPFGYLDVSAMGRRLADMNPTLTVNVSRWQAIDRFA